MAPDVLVVFHGAGHFDHCFCVVQEGGAWIMVNGARGRPVIETLPTDPTQCYRDAGLIVVTAPRRLGAMRWPLMPMSCVAVCKRIVGIRNPFIVTARQLRRHLEVQ